jgi:hypothetical protein
MALILSGDTGVPASGMPTGSVIQTVNATYSTLVSNSTSTFADTGLTATITPISVTSKILVVISQQGVGKLTNNTAVQIQLLRNSTVIQTTSDIWGYNGQTTTSNRGMTVAMNCLDSPATTSAVTYKTQFCSYAGNIAAYCQDFGNTQNAISSITLMEIKA